MDLKIHQLRKNQSGQGTTEFILLMVLGIALFAGLISAMKSSKLIDSVAVQPWSLVSGMIECGVWKACGISSPAPGYHPSNRPISYRPDQVGGS